MQGVICCVQSPLTLEKPVSDRNRPVRLWYQSFIDVEAQAPYFERLRTHLDAIKAPGTVIDIHGLSPPDRWFHPVTEFRGAEQTIRNAIRAKAEGYDAFVIGHFPDPGLLECRGAVDMPVIGLGESTLLHGCTMGRRIGLITINPVFVPYIEAQVAAYGLQERVIGVSAIDADVDRFMQAFTDPEAQKQVRAEFEALVTPHVAAGADVIIPSGGMPMLLFSQMQPFTVAGAAVMEGPTVVLKMAEAAVAIHRITGVVAGRNGQYRLAPPGAISDFVGG